jgi:hypothetical protein
MLTASPMIMFATMGMKYSRNILSAMVFDADGAWMTDSAADGVAERGSTQGRAFFRCDSGFLMKLVGQSKPSYTILFSSTTGENKQSYPV